MVIDSVAECRKTHLLDKIYLDTELGGQKWIDADVHIYDEFIKCFDKKWKNREFDDLEVCSDRRAHQKVLN